MICQPQGNRRRGRFATQYTGGDDEYIIIETEIPTTSDSELDYDTADEQI